MHGRLLSRGVRRVSSAELVLRHFKSDDRNLAINSLGSLSFAIRRYLFVCFNENLSLISAPR